MRWLRRLWPRRLLGQTVLLVLVALLAAQIASALILRSETRALQRDSQIRLLAERTASMVSLFKETAPSNHTNLSEAVSNRRMKVWISEAPLVMTDTEFHDAVMSERLVAAINEQPETENLADVRVAQEGANDSNYDFGPHGPFADLLRQSGAPRRAVWGDVFVSAPLQNGGWLNLSVDVRKGQRLMSPQSWIAFVFAAVAISLIVFLLLRRLTNSLDGLSSASARLGRGETIAPLDERGPADVRETIRAFNTMQERLHRFVSDRTRMVAAVSHDLRTPITSLRLRAEMVADAELREKMIATLEEMQQMVEDTLAFAQNDAKQEETRNVSLRELLHALADDFQDTGCTVQIEIEDDIVYPCRPTAIRRALQNLIQNGCRYGDGVEIRMISSEKGVSVYIYDTGPGIPEADLERVFEPFVTLDEARNRERSGSGLGLAIARDIVRHHGGDIVLRNRAEGGLEAELMLPAVD